MWHYIKPTEDTKSMIKWQETKANSVETDYTCKKNPYFLLKSFNKKLDGKMEMINTDIKTQIQLKQR